MAARRPRVEYDVDIRGATVYILTNLNAPNFRVMQSRLPQPYVYPLELPIVPERLPWHELRCVDGVGACQQRSASASASASAEGGGPASFGAHFLHFVLKFIPLD